MYYTTLGSVQYILAGRNMILPLHDVRSELLLIRDANHTCRPIYDDLMAAAIVLRTAVRYCKAAINRACWSGAQTDIHHNTGQPSPDPGMWAGRKSSLFIFHHTVSDSSDATLHLTSCSHQASCETLVYLVSQQHDLIQILSFCGHHGRRIGGGLRFRLDQRNQSLHPCFDNWRCKQASDPQELADSTRTRRAESE